MRGCFCIFVYIWMMSSSPGSRPIEPISWLKVFVDSRLQYESLEGLMDLLAFLVQKLWRNNQNLKREIPLIPQGILEKIRSSGRTFGTRNARQSIKGSKDSYYSLESK